MNINKKPNIPRKIQNIKLSKKLSPLFTSSLKVVVVGIDCEFDEVVEGSEVFFVFSKAVEVIVGSDFLVVVE